MRAKLSSAWVLMRALPPRLARTASLSAALSRTAALNAWALVAVVEALLAWSASLRTVTAANSTTITTRPGTSH